MKVLKIEINKMKNTKIISRILLFCSNVLIRSQIKLF